MTTGNDGANDQLRCELGGRAEPLDQFSGFRLPGHDIGAFGVDGTGTARQWFAPSYQGLAAGRQKKLGMLQTTPVGVGQLIFTPAGSGAARVTFEAAWTSPSSSRRDAGSKEVGPG